MEKLALTFPKIEILHNSCHPPGRPTPSAETRRGPSAPPPERHPARKTPRRPGASNGSRRARRPRPSSVAARGGGGGTRRATPLAAALDASRRASAAPSSGLRGQRDRRDAATAASGEEIPPPPPPAASGTGGRERADFPLPSSSRRLRPEQRRSPREVGRAGKLFLLAASSPSTSKRPRLAISDGAFCIANNAPSLSLSEVFLVGRAELPRFGGRKTSRLLTKSSTKKGVFSVLFWERRPRGRRDARRRRRTSRARASHRVTCAVPRAWRCRGPPRTPHAGAEAWHPGRLGTWRLLHDQRARASRCRRTRVSQCQRQSELRPA